MVEWEDRVCFNDRVACWWVRSGLFTLGTEWGLGKVTKRIGVEGWAGGGVGLMCAWAVAVASRRWSCVMSLEGAVIPQSTAAQSAMARISLSAGMMEGLVMDLC
jgi:hypothetical protein